MVWVPWMQVQGKVRRERERGERDAGSGSRMVPASLARGTARRRGSMRVGVPSMPGLGLARTAQREEKRKTGEQGYEQRGHKMTR